MAAPPQGGTRPPPYQLSSEETRVMRECNQESFYSRCLPISTVLMVGTQFMIRSGRWRTSTFVGSLARIVGAGALGFVIGKISYVSTCKERMMALPDSRIGHALRMREQQIRTGVAPQPGFSDLSPAEPAEHPPPAAGWTPPRAPGGGLDDYYRPSVDSSDTSAPLSGEEPPAQYTTYEQLRRQNRAEAEARLRRGSGEQAPPSSGMYQPTGRPPPPPPPREPAEAPAPAGKTNKYGDVWEN